MRILDRYILKSVLTIFLLCFLVFFFLYIVIDLFAHLDDILKNKVSLQLLYYYYAAFLPVILIQVSPISCLLSTLYTFARMNRENELIAMRASGLSILQMTKPLIIFGVLLSLLIFWVNDKLIPAANLYSQRIRQQIENENKPVQPAKELGALKNLSVYGSHNRLFVINAFYPSKNLMEGITILEHDARQNIVKKIWAEKGEFKDGLWRFYRSITSTFENDGQMKESPQFMEEEIMTITETPRDFLNQRQEPAFMSIAQLEEYIWKLSRSGASGVIRKFRIDLYQRYLSPFTSLMIILLSIPFAFMMRRRSGGLASLGLALVVGFLYYILNAVSIALGNAGILPELLSASLVHMLALLTSIYLIFKIL